MNKLISLLLLFTCSAFGADQIIGLGGTNWLIDSASKKWNSAIFYTTDGNGHIQTLNGITPVSDPVKGVPPYNVFTDATGRDWIASVCYTTDGAGNVVPISSGGGGGGSGTVTSVSIVSANGLAGTVATATTTPAVTLSTTVNGIVKGNGTALSAAVSNTDYQAPISTSAAPAHRFGTGFTAPNTFTYAQPAFSDITGQSTAAQMLALPSADLYVGTAGNQPAAVALSGDASITNAGNLTVANSVNRVYVDFLVGNDGSGTGSPIRPWKTLQHACSSIAPTINNPFTVYISGGNNDSDVGTITCPPNITLVGDYPIQVGVPLTITGGATNDSVGFVNLIFVGAVTWVRNDATVMGMSLTNTQFFSGPVFKQNGAGTASMTANNSVTVNLDIKTGGTGSFFTGHNFLGSTTFEDANASAYYQIMGGYVGGAMSIAGGPFAYFSGVQFDVPFGASLTTSTTANGTPTLQTDSGSVPGSITGPNTLALQSFSQHEAYVPTTSGQWSAPPSDVKGALDEIASGGLRPPSWTVNGMINATTSVTDSGSVAGEMSASSHTTVDGSNTTIGVQGVANAVVDSGATNDKAVAAVFGTATRGNGSDDGTLHEMDGAYALMFHNSGSAGVTDKVITIGSTMINQKGTITNLYDVKPESVPAGGAVTNHFGLYIEASPFSVTKQSFIAGATLMGGSSFTTPVEALEIVGNEKISAGILDGSSALSVHPSNRQLIYPGGGVAYDWGNAAFYRPSTVAALDLGNSYLIDTAGNPLLYFGVPGTVGLTGVLISETAIGAAVVDANAGTGATCTATGDDIKGQVSITTGAAALATGSYCNIPFGTSYPTNKVCSLTAASATISNSVYVSAPSTSSFDVNFAVAATPVSTYVLNYQCL